MAIRGIPCRFGPPPTHFLLAPGSPGRPLGYARRLGLVKFSPVATDQEIMRKIFLILAAMLVASTLTACGGAVAQTSSTAQSDAKQFDTSDVEIAIENKILEDNTVTGADASCTQDTAVHLSCMVEGETVYVDVDDAGGPFSVVWDVTIDPKSGKYIAHSDASTLVLD
jgi:hypothetical protein